jgi:hypothetical protein
VRRPSIEGRYVVALFIVIFATGLYAAGLVSGVGSTPVEPQSVFTLYGTILGYLFGSHEKKHDQTVEALKEGTDIGGTNPLQ